MKQFSEINSQEKAELTNTIKTLGKWLYMDSGLGLKDTIREIFDEQEWSKKLNSFEISKFMFGLDILKKTTMPEDWIRSILRKRVPNGVSNLKLVRDELGNWHPVNKLNTSHTDLSEMLSEMIMKARVANPEKAEEFYNFCLQNPKDALLSIKGSLKKLLIKYFTLEDFKKFTKNSSLFTRIGEESEVKISQMLEKYGFKIEYSGGDGDFIDMLFGVDLVVSRPDLGFKTVQVKTNMPDPSQISYYKVDWIGVASTGLIYDKSTGQVVKEVKKFGD